MKVLTRVPRSKAYPDGVLAKAASRPWGRVVLGAVALAGAAGMVYRLGWGLGAATNLSDGWPWGWWIAFDVMAGVALAAGAFVVAAWVHVFGWERYARRPKLPGLPGGLAGQGRRTAFSTRSRPRSWRCACEPSTGAWRWKRPALGASHGRQAVPNASSWAPWSSTGRSAWRGWVPSRLRLRGGSSSCCGFWRPIPGGSSPARSCCCGCGVSKRRPPRSARRCSSAACGASFGLWNGPQR